MPTSWPAHPPCRTRATTPYAAATDSRFIAAALRATTTLRNDTSSRSIDSSTTPPISSGIRLAMLCVLSIDVAVTPPTCTASPVPAVAAGSTVSRRWWTRSSVVGDCGPVVGMTVSTAVLPAGLTGAGVTAATPGRGAQRGRHRVERRGASARRQLGDQQQRTVGARAEAADSWSYAGRVEVPSRSLPASGKPKRTLRNGAASASRMTTPAAAAMMRCRSTSLLQASQSGTARRGHRPRRRRGPDGRAAAAAGRRGGRGSPAAPGRA